MARSKTGEAIPAEQRTAASIAELERFRDECRAHGDLWEWLRARAVLGYVGGQRVVDLAVRLEVGRSTVNGWLRRYARRGVDPEAQATWVRKRLPALKKSRGLRGCSRLRRPGQLLARRDTPSDLVARGSPTPRADAR